MSDEPRSPDDRTPDELPARPPEDPAIGDEPVRPADEPVPPDTEPVRPEPEPLPDAEPVPPPELVPAAGTESVPPAEDRADSEPREPDDHRTSPRLSTTSTVIVGVVVFLIFAYVGYWVMSRVLGG